MRLTLSGLLIITFVAVVSCRSDDGTTAPTQPVVTVEALRGSPRATVATVTACGASVVTNLRLEEDLTCAGDGLIVDNDGIRIDLNGPHDHGRWSWQRHYGERTTMSRSRAARSGAS